MLAKPARALRWIGLIVLLAVAVGYVQPLRAYRDATADVAKREAEVDGSPRGNVAARAAHRGGRDARVHRAAGAEARPGEAGRTAVHRHRDRRVEARAPGAVEGRGYDDLVDDRRVVSWQLGRPARTFRRVAVRCAHGFPAVTEQAPFGPDGEPFPTTYYLTCPWLVAAVARLEAAGGVERWSRAAAEDRRLGASLARADREQRELRPELDVGIGGTRGQGSSSACTRTRPSPSPSRPTNQAT